MFVKLVVHAVLRPAGKRGETTTTIMILRTTTTETIKIITSIGIELHRTRDVGEMLTPNWRKKTEENKI